MSTFLGTNLISSRWSGSISPIWCLSAIQPTTESIEYHSCCVIKLSVSRQNALCPNGNICTIRDKWRGFLRCTTGEESCWTRHRRTDWMTDTAQRFGQDWSHPGAKFIFVPTDLHVLIYTGALLRKRHNANALFLFFPFFISLSVLALPSSCTHNLHGIFRSSYFTQSMVIKIQLLAWIPHSALCLGIRCTHSTASVGWNDYTCIDSLFIEWRFYNWISYGAVNGRNYYK